MQQPSMQPIAPKGGRRWVWIVVAAFIVIAAVVWWYIAYQLMPTPTAPEAPAPFTGGDTTSDIQEDLQAVDLGDVGAELDQLDQDINQL